MRRSTCVEFFGLERQRAKYGARPDGVCGQPAERLVSVMGEPWTPRCIRCANFYAPDCVVALTGEVDGRIAEMQGAVSR